MGNTNKAVQDLKRAIDHFAQDNDGDDWTAKDERLLQADVRDLKKILVALKKEDGKALAQAIRIDNSGRYCDSDWTQYSRWSNRIFLADVLQSVIWR